MMNILVTMRVVENATYLETRDAISHEWSCFFNYHNLLPILVPNQIDNPSRYFDFNPRGLLLTNGESIGGLGSVTKRDTIEMQLISKAIEERIPIFGVCRGLQILNRYFGGEIKRTSDHSHVGDHLVNIAGKGIVNVNSFHNDVVNKNSLAEHLVPFAICDDGVVEGFRHDTLPIVAIQWHPERQSPSAAIDMQIIEQWKKLCAS